MDERYEIMPLAASTIERIYWTQPGETPTDPMVWWPVVLDGVWQHVPLRWDERYLCCRTEEVNA